MLLVIDVGNTNTVMGVFDGTSLLTSWRVDSNNNATADEKGILLHTLLKGAKIDPKSIDGTIISSVVPNIMYSLTQGIRKYLHREPLVVGAGMKTGILLRGDNPKEIGADRIVKMVAAKELYGGPAIVISYGTVDAFDVLGEKGDFLMGYLTPGIQICADALYKKTAQLPKVEIKRQQSIMANGIVERMQAGLVFGHIGATRYIIDCLKKELSLAPETKVISTGGMARVIDDKNEIFTISDPMLSLKGLQILYQKNTTQR